MSKVILVTGTCTRLGKRVAQRLASEGYRVIAGMPDPRGVDRDTARHLAAFSNVEVLQVDLADDWSVAGAIAQVLERHGSIDVLINHTGAPQPVTTLEDATTSARFRATFEQSLYGVLRTYEAVLPAMRERNSGLVINITAAERAKAFAAPDRASKMAVEALTEGFHDELRGSRVESVSLRAGSFPVELITDEVLELVRMPQGSRPTRVCLESGLNTSFRARAAV